MVNIIRSHVARVVREVAAKYAEEMIGIQVQIARDETNFPADRLKATALVLDRAAGKPTQEQAIESESVDMIAQRVRDAAEQARIVMNPLLVAPSMAQVIDLYPDKKNKEFSASPKLVSRIPRRKLSEG